ncbi:MULTISPECIES: gamma-mobile-trio protein GmtX [Acinetobacter calcoaceticus/baumannii complex]|uniref:gamma-mobile-trio protein GmtX n=1 Tax=Acinetobacter calcoaceticus/baumannii complex TaxID=909768 RepID=UPI000BF5C3ED|nr:gamma-mobile-trio protein GmtX [Acinetobacter baumannii]
MNDNFEEFLEELKIDKHSRVQQSLDRLNSILNEHYLSGSKDFSIATICRITKKKNFLSESSIRNSSGIVYQLLINKWKEKVSNGKHSTRNKKYNLGPYEKIIRDKIQDQALQLVLLQLLVEKNNLERKLKVFTDKIDGQPRYMVDMRKISKQLVLSKDRNLTLTIQEVEALKDSLFNETNLVRKFWNVQESGAVKDLNGDQIYKNGYIDAMKKILDFLNDL